MADFSMFPDRGDLGVSIAFDHRRAAHELIRRIGGFAQPGDLRVSRREFPDRIGFAGEAGFIQLQIDRLQHSGIRRNLFALFDENHIAHHQIAPGHHHKRPVPDHLVGKIVVALVQQVELLLRPVFVQEGDEGRQQNRHQNAAPLDPVADQAREHRSNHQNPDHRITELAQILNVPRNADRSGQYVAAMLCTAEFHLFVRQASVVEFFHIFPSLFPLIASGVSGRDRP